MTNGVKQALPQVLTQKTGVEGKTARKGAPQADFAETLGIGKFARQLKSGEARIDRHEVEARPSWQRLAARLDTAIGRTQPMASKLAVMPEPDNEPQRSAEDVAAIAWEMPEPAAIGSTPEAAPTFVAYTAPGAIPADPVEAENPASDSPMPGMLVGRDASVEGRRGQRPAPTDNTPQDNGNSPSLPTTKDEPYRPAAIAPGAKPLFVAPATEPVAAAGAAKDKDSLPEAAGDTARTAPRVTILAQQNIPAPMPSTATVLVESITGSDLLEPARNKLVPDAIHAAATHGSAHSLKIQLHPAELGMVTATLRFAGEQLSIELQVENHAAYRRLSSDSDMIVNSLRDLGYEIDGVTVLQPSLAPTSGGRSDAGASMPSPQGRAPEQSGSGPPGGGNGGSGERQHGNGGNAGQNGQQNAVAARENQGNGLFI